MIGLVVVTHAGLGRELLKAAEMIVGPLERAEAVGILPEDKVEAIREGIAGAIERVGQDGVILMTDMFGGTPSNMSLSFLQEKRVEVLTGVNLPMIIKFASDRLRHAVTDLAPILKESARESISVAGDYLKK
ncbi:PTS sugar transporter subunit IIA [Geobacter sp. DSM 9736]|uniref:PTS sugar transporter subunit IIA n=1 Tax=Geobacter sp. DSM 9736 TaxID=1277350 RepID=UPI000B505554|nr:PTS sugar transporter [Geobacter sp. DSM 9736]SNB46417.1 PTS system, mannose-specific IIA component [Geobacter sp. DSM 9736]